MTRLTPGSDTSAALGKAFKPHGFHDACDLLVIDRAEIRITVETAGLEFDGSAYTLTIDGAAGVAGVPTPGVPGGVVSGWCGGKRVEPVF